MRNLTKEEQDLVREHMTVQERVNAGAALLDSKMPGWENKIDLNLLKVQSIYYCPLGQLYGDFYKGAQIFGVMSAAAADYGFDREGGFMSDTDTSLELYEELDNAWKTLILNRRAIQQIEKEVNQHEVPVAV